MHEHSEQSLAEVLAEQAKSAPDDLAPQVAAAQIMAVWRTLRAENPRRVAAGEAVDDIYPATLASAGRSFDMLEFGLGGYGAP